MRTIPAPAPGRVVGTRLTVIGEIRGSKNPRLVSVLCDCGQTAEVGLHNLRAGKHLSCGCAREEMWAAMRAHFRGTP